MPERGPARSSRPRPRERAAAVVSGSVTAPQDRGSSRRVPLLWPPHGQRDTARARSGALNPAEDGSSLGAPAPHPRPPRTGSRALRPGPGCADGRGPAGPARPPPGPREAQPSPLRAGGRFFSGFPVASRRLSTSVFCCSHRRHRQVSLCAAGGRQRKERNSPQRRGLATGWLPTEPKGRERGRSGGRVPLSPGRAVGAAAYLGRCVRPG